MIGSTACALQDRERGRGHLAAVSNPTKTENILCEAICKTKDFGQGFKTPNQSTKEDIMKTTMLAGLDNLVFSAADLLNPKEMKLVGFATTIEESWNIYDEHGAIKENIEEIPIMPIEAAGGYEPDCLILAAANREDEDALRYMVYRIDYRGEVISLFDFFQGFSLKTAAIRKLCHRLNNLGVEGAAADLGAYYGDISWQLNALMPDRKLYLFDTFTGYDARDIAKEQELQLSDAKAGQFSFTPKEQQNLEAALLGRMPYPDRIIIRKGWFPETAYDLEDERYALVHLDAGLYQPTYFGIQYFFSRMSQGGVMLLSGYEDGKSQSVRQAVQDLEKQYGAFLIAPLNDLDGTIVISHP